MEFQNTEPKVLLQDIVDTVHGEQLNIGLFIHGEICGTLLAAKMRLRNRQRKVVKKRKSPDKEAETELLDDVLQHLDEVYEQLRVISHTMAPTLVREYGIARAIEMYNTELQQTNKMYIHLVRETEPDRLPLDYETDRRLFALYCEMLSYFSEFIKCSELLVFFVGSEGQIKMSFINEHSETVTENSDFPQSAKLTKKLNVIQGLLFLLGATLDESSDFIEKVQILIPGNS